MASYFGQSLAHRHNLALIIAVGALMAGCGGGSSKAPIQATPAPAPATQPPQASTERGALIGAPGQAISFSAGQIDTAAASKGYATLTSPAKCAVSYHAIEYNTIGSKGEATNATAGLFIPSGSHSACQGPRPLMMYGRGTDTQATLSPVSAAEKARELSFFAAQGYIVVTPNYTGYAGSRLPYHPYHVAEAQAADAIDALRAARTAVKQLGASVSDKLFLTGMSQGGYVAMATHRTMERDFPSEFKVTASAPIGGVYAVTKTMTDVLHGRAMTSGTILFQLIITAYQKTYGNLYQQPSDIYMAPYATGVETVAPGPYGMQEIYAAGILPQNLFDKGDGMPFLIKSAVRDSLKANPGNAFFAASAKNDLLDWKPRAPMILCGTSADQMSFFSNSTEAAAAFAKQGVTVPVMDVEVRATLNPGPIGDAASDHYRASRAARPESEPHGMGHAPCFAQAFSFFESK